MTSPAASIRSEVHQLIQLQIQTFKQPTSITTDQLNEYRHRSNKIRVLYAELDRLGREKIAGELLLKAS